MPGHTRSCWSAVRSGGAGIAILLAAGSPAPAADRPAADYRAAGPVRRPELFSRLLDCRAIADSAQRLACYDRQVAALDSAAQNREIVITDRAQVQEVRRSLFGFTAPLGRMLGAAGDAAGGAGGDADDLKQIDTTVTAVRRSRDGGWKLGFAGSGTWEQADTRNWALSPRVGNAARIVRGALGSYFVSVNGQPGIRMRRVE